MSKDRLLSDEELEKRVRNIVIEHKTFNADTESNISLEVDEWLDLINTQKRLYAESLRSKDPHLCEFGHEVYSHNTVDGWCCACEADQAFMEAEIEARVKEATAAVKQDSDDMSRFIAALLIQSGGSVTVTKRTLIEIPTPSKIDFEQLANVDGSITMALRQDDYEALTTTTNGKEE